MNRLITTLAVLLFSASLFGQVMKYSEVNVSLSGKPLSALAALGIPVEEGSMVREGTLKIILSAQELTKLAQAGFTWVVLTDDYSATITERNRQLASTITEINSQIKDGTLSSGSYAVPQGFELGSMGGFYTLEQAYEEMDSLHDLYPDIVSAKAQFNTTTTIEGRPVYFMKISDNPDVNENEPRVFYNGLTHAREPIGMQQLFFFMNYLCEHYATDPEIQYLVNNTEMYFVPVMNPDGYHQNQVTNPIGGGMWRKNKRNNLDGNYGVDINRNYGYMWGYDDIGSSPNTYDETYRGTAPFSEPETQIARDFSNDKDFKLALNYHSYAGLMLYPWSYITAQTPDSVKFMTWADMLVRDNQFTTGTPGSVLYNTNGDANDWMYGDITLHPELFSFTPEVGNDNDGFWPLASRIVPLSQQCMLTDLLLAHLSYRYAEATDESPVIIGDRQGYFHYQLKRYGLDNDGEYTVSIQPLDNTVITSTGAPKTFSGLDLFETADDSVSYVISPDLPIGSEFKFLLQVNNGFYTHSDTITKYFGPPMVVFTDDCSDFSNWTSTKWNTTSAKFFSPPKSITDSPSGNYANNENNSVTMVNPVDLLDSPVAVIEYMARWNIEKGFDYAQVKATAGLNYVPLAGKYTHTAGPNQPAGQPVYDGIRNDWVKEQIVTTGYVNQDITLRFTLRSDTWTTADGFYFDDLKVIVIDMSGVGIDTPPAEGAYLSEPTPNPAGSNATLRYRLPEGYAGQAWLKVVDVRGTAVCNEKIEIPKGEITLNTSGFAPGVYLCRLEATGITAPVRKLLVIR
jgi:carboxypeptidase T